MSKKIQFSGFLYSVLGSLTLLMSSINLAQAQSAETFDIDRYSTYGEGWFETYYVTEDDMQSLQALLDAGTVNAEMDLLVTETALGNLAMLKSQMSFHHIAQGTADGKNWMATF